MANVIEITDFSAPELDVYARLTEAQLLNRFEPAKGNAAASLDTATGKTRRLIEDLNARGSLTFYPLGDGYQDTLDSLFTNLRSTMDELDALSDAQLEEDSRND